MSQPVPGVVIADWAGAGPRVRTRGATACRAALRLWTVVAVTAANCLLLLIQVAPASAQQRTGLWTIAAQQGAEAKAQSQWIEKLEAYAAAQAGQRGSVAYWAIIEANLGKLAVLRTPGGARSVLAELDRQPEFAPAKPPRGAGPAYAKAVEAYVASLKDGRRIFGGRKSGDGQFPEVVALARPVCTITGLGAERVPCRANEIGRDGLELAGFDAFCTGTLIAENAVLTAAHCLCRKTGLGSYEPIGPSDYAVVFGRDVRNAGPGVTGYAALDHVIKHELSPANITQDAHAQLCRNFDVDGNFRGRDLALAFLGEALAGAETSAEAPPKPKPIGIAAPELLFGFSPGARLNSPRDTALEALLVGFGYTEQIVEKPAEKPRTGVQYFTTVAVEQLVCQGDAANGATVGKGGCAPGKEMVAVGSPLRFQVAAANAGASGSSGDAPPPDTCLGDSGGPLFLLDGVSRRYLVAATSRGGDVKAISAKWENEFGCGGGGIYSLITRQAINWLSEQNELNILLCTAPGVCSQTSGY